MVQGPTAIPGARSIHWISLDTVNQAYLFNPRNSYQNYVVAANSSDRVLHTYMGMLMPRLGNITYSSAGQLSPLLNDPEYRAIGIGTRVFLGGATGYVAWEGTQHNPGQARNKDAVPLGPAGTLALIGDLKDMDLRFLRACTFAYYGPSLYLGVGIPIPLLDEDMAHRCGVSDAEIHSRVLDYGCPGRSRPILGCVSYAQLRTGYVDLNGRRVRSAPLSSYSRAREVADRLKQLIQQGQFTIQPPVAPLRASGDTRSLEEVQP